MRAAPSTRFLMSSFGMPLMRRPNDRLRSTVIVG
jgi:hypothetical protein